MKTSYYRKIKELREDNDIRQEALSCCLGCSIRTYQRYEKGMSEIPAKRVILLSQFYNVSANYLLGVSENKGSFHPAIVPINIRLKFLRSINNIPEKQISDILSCPRQTYSQFESGKKNIPTNMMIILANLYNTSLDYLLGLDVVPKSLTVPANP